MNEMISNTQYTKKHRQTKCDKNEVKSKSDQLIVV